MFTKQEFGSVFSIGLLSSNCRCFSIDIYDFEYKFWFYLEMCDLQNVCEIYKLDMKRVQLNMVQILAWEAIALVRCIPHDPLHFLMFQSETMSAVHLEMVFAMHLYLFGVS